MRVGREVGAHGVVSGAYQSLGDRIRVTARVTETATGRVVLNPRVDGAREAIFELQDRLVAELVAGLRGQLPAARPEETQSLEAYEACSKGLLNLQEESQESIDRAIVFFERAVALDPGYARAHMLLGAALDLKGDYLTTPELSERALVSLDRALALRPDSAEAWRYRGSALITLNRDEEALAAFESALARNPMDASAQSGIARVHFILRGDFARAAAAYERALVLNPRAGWSALQLAHCATLLRDFPRAEAAARRAIELQQAFLSGRAGMVIVGAHMRLGHAFALQGRHRDALARVRERGGVPAERGPRAPRAHRHRAAPEDRRGAPPARRGGGGPGRPRPGGRGLRAEDAHRRRRRHEPLLRGRRPRAARRKRSPPSPAWSEPRPVARVSPPPAPRSSPRSKRCATSRASGRLLRPSGRRRPRRAPSPPPPRGGGSPGRAAARARS